MLKRIKPSPAMAVALLALFVALGSGAYAQAVNSVDTAQLRNGAVTNAKLARNSVWNAQIGGGVVRTNNLARDSVRNNNIARNSVWHAQLGGGVVQQNNLNAALASELPATDEFYIGYGIQLNPCCTYRDMGAITIKTTGSGWVLAVGAPLFENRSSTAADVLCQFRVNGIGSGSGQSSVPASGRGQVTVLSRMFVPKGPHRIELGCFDFNAGDVITRPSDVILIGTGTSSLR